MKPLRQCTSRFVVHVMWQVFKEIGNRGRSFLETSESHRQMQITIWRRWARRENDKRGSRECVHIDGDCEKQLTGRWSYWWRWVGGCGLQVVVKSDIGCMFLYEVRWGDECRRNGKTLRCVSRTEKVGEFSLFGKVVIEWCRFWQCHYAFCWGVFICFASWTIHFKWVPYSYTPTMDIDQMVSHNESKCGDVKLFESAGRHWIVDK